MAQPDLENGHEGHCCLSGACRRHREEVLPLVHNHLEALLLEAINRVTQNRIREFFCECLVLDDPRLAQSNKGHSRCSRNAP